ncbi:unnamed protein product [Parascedosporium putredinis]|uniref:Transcription initiation factor TFIID subunit 2 n=1 Tax=Parascedosporium putredinis TaxID=1442378 RepID=A0A9P1H9E5_9PEZI|nr:unnamed protein product [Parascedosporium putredinis]CAI8003400.1 unnamed protein product [Parascedosporium putredinis]
MAPAIGGFQDVSDTEDRDKAHFSDEEPPPIRDAPPSKYFLIRQDVELEINFLERSVKGKTEIMVHGLDGSALQDIAIDARQCTIETDKITVQKYRNGQPLGPQTRDTDLPAEDRRAAGCTPVDGSLQIKIKPDDTPGNQRIIVRKPSANGANFSLDGRADDETSYLVSIPFETKDMRDGLHFVGIEPGDMRYPHAYTRHSYEPGTACSLFPCIDDAGALGDWKISIKCPRTLGDVLHQPLVTQRQANGNGGGDDQSADATAVEHVLSEEDKLLEMTVVMTFEAEKATSVHNIGFAVGPFEHVDLFSDFRTEEDDEKLGASALKIHGYCLPRRADWVRNTCVALATAADYLSLTFSGYPYDSYKLCFVEDLPEDTLPLYSFSFISTRLLYPERMIDTEVDVTRMLVHSLATQWSGICVLPNTRRDRWVTTGIAYYMTDLFMKKICGNNEYRFRIKVAADKLVEMDVNRPSLYDLGQYLHVGDFEREFMDLKAPLVLFILDKRIVKATSGSHNLTQILSRLFTKAKIEGDNVITTKSFRKLCEKSSKYSLDTFWEQWVFGSGCPRIQVTHRFNKKRLCVEMTISQVQSDEDATRKEMLPSDFLRAVKEKQYGVVAGPVQPLFTGPITIRIHEADGTPYEHIVEIREDTAQKRMVKFDIPYNTKYKRLKRRREKKQANAGAAAEAAAAGNDEGFLYCLGDTISAPGDMERFLAEEYNEATERQMDAESYEWLRVDTDFEWLCSMKVGMAHYMFVSQLQQDRDVVAQEDTLLYIQRETPHPVASTVLVRTLMDIKYFHGIRTMAAELLRSQCNEAMGMRGMTQLEMAFRDLFCIPGTNTPKPNDFSDKRQYLVQCAIPESLSQVRDRNGKCPLHIKRFILDILRLNNNSQNDFNDDMYVAKLISSVANSLITNSDAQQSMAFTFDEDEADTEREEQKFKEEALEEINRHLRRDEWSHSHHNVWTVAGLDAKQRLMKAGVIPVDGLDFVKYLQDATYDGVRIKAWAALVDLGFMIEPVIFRLFMCCLSTDRSPYVRDRLMKIFCEGLATIAFGEYAKPKTSAGPSANGAAAIKSDPDLDMADADDDGLVVVNNEATERAHKAQQELARRKRDLDLALGALKKEMESTYVDVERELQRAVWKAIDSPAMGRTERVTLLELCATMFDEADRWIIALQYPKRWKVSRGPHHRAYPASLKVTFKSYYRTKPVHYEPIPAVVPAAPAPAPAPAEPKRPLILARSSSIKVSRPSISATPRGLHRGIPASAAAAASAVAATPKPQIERKNTLSISTTSSNKSAKRPRDKLQEGQLAGSPAPKKAKIDGKVALKNEKTPKGDKSSKSGAAVAATPAAAATASTTTPRMGTPSKRSRIVTLRHPRSARCSKGAAQAEPQARLVILVVEQGRGQLLLVSVQGVDPGQIGEETPAHGAGWIVLPAATNGGEGFPAPPRPKIMLKLKRPDPPS